MGPIRLSRNVELSAMAIEGEKLDVIIFGATGFTGKIAVYEMVKLAKEKSITWGISGRNRNKLDNVLKEVEEKTDANLAAIRVIVADVEDESSLREMASQAGVVVNCVGPYRFYGEPVMRACIASSAHYVDVSAEPQFMERMQLDYHKAAEEKGVYAISSCAFGSVAADLGTVFLLNKFQGDLNSVETCQEFGPVVLFKGPKAHFGTWESAVYILAHYNELRSIRRKLHADRLPSFSPKLQRRCLFKKEQVDGWCVPFSGSDRSVMMRSQRYFFEHEKVRPAQIQSYIVFKSVFFAVAVGIFALILLLLSKLQFGRHLLLKYPRVFSGGLMSHEGPSEEQRKKSYMNFTLFGEGWKEKLAEPTDQHDSPPNKHIVVKVSGKDAGYGLTSTILLLAAVTVLKESDKMPGRGGVYTPGVAFARTSLLEELDKHGAKFEVLSLTEN